LKSSRIRSVTERDGILLIGTISSEIYEVAEDTIDFISLTSHKDSQTMVKTETETTNAATCLVTSTDPNVIMNLKSSQKYAKNPTSKKVRRKSTQSVVVDPEITELGRDF
jgi:hypothetical protein